MTEYEELKGVATPILEEAGLILVVEEPKWSDTSGHRVKAVKQVFGVRVRTGNIRPKLTNKKQAGINIESLL